MPSPGFYYLGDRSTHHLNGKHQVRGPSAQWDGEREADPQHSIIPSTNQYLLSTRSSLSMGRRAVPDHFISCLCNWGVLHFEKKFVMKIFKWISCKLGRNKQAGIMRWIRTWEERVSFGRQVSSQCDDNRRFHTPFPGSFSGQWIKRTAVIPVTK